MKITKIFFLVLLSMLTTIVSAKPKESDLPNGIAAYKAGKYVDAIDYITSYIEIKPKNPVAYYYRSLAYEAAGSQQHAMYDADLALQLVGKLPKESDVKNTDLMMQKARTKLMVGDTTSALDALDRAILANDKLAVPYALKAKILFDQMNFDACEKVTATALSIDPNNVVALVQDAKNKQNRENLADAIVSLDKALKVSPKDEEALILHSDLSTLLKRYDKAFSDYVTLVEGMQEPDEFVRQLVILGASCPDHAIKISSDKIKQGKNNAFWLQVRCGVYNAAGKSKEALADCDALEKMMGETMPEIQRMRGISHFDLRNYDVAEKELAESLEGVKDGEVAARLAYIKKFKGEFDVALRLANEAVLSDIMNYEYYYLRGMVYLMKGLGSDAQSEFEVGLQQNNYFTPLYYQRALLFRKNSETKAKADVDFERVIRLDTVTRPDRYFRPLAFYYLGKPDEGLASLKGLLHDYPTPDNNYTAAEFYAAIGDKQKSLEHLRIALSNGYCDFSMIDNDDLLRKYNNDPDFKSLVQKYRKEFIKDDTPDAANMKGYVGSRTGKVLEMTLNKEHGHFCVPVKVCGVSIGAYLDSTIKICTMPVQDALFFTKYGFIAMSEWQISPEDRVPGAGEVVTISSMEIAGYTIKGLRVHLVANPQDRFRIPVEVLEKFGDTKFDKTTQLLRIVR